MKESQTHEVNNNKKKILRSEKQLYTSYRIPLKHLLRRRQSYSSHGIQINEIAPSVVTAAYKKPPLNYTTKNSVTTHVPGKSNPHRSRSF